MAKRKLIEVSIPLEVINKQAAREKSIRHGHPSTLHLWWARRPLAAARAVLFAQLVDDPSSDDSLPVAEQDAERLRLHELIGRLVDWDNVRDEKLFAEARAEIMKSTGGNPPPILDPFAGGGTIPLEAQRLGLEAHASDLNPVAVLINKALIEFPPKFRDWQPVYPGLAASQIGSWQGAGGLAADVRAYSQWMRDEAEKRIGHLYPKADSKTVIAWIWARTVTCPNPACGIEMPLVRSWWLGKKKGKEAHIVPEVRPDETHPSGRRVHFSIATGSTRPLGPVASGTIDRGSATCLACGSAVDNGYIRAQARGVGLGATLMAVVGEGHRRRNYLSPTDVQRVAARVERPVDVPSQDVPQSNHDVDRLPMYGMRTWADAFTNRQLTALCTFSDLVAQARELVYQAAVDSGLRPGDRLDEGGTEAAAYADAVAVYLGMIVSRLTDYQSSITTWASNPQMEILRNVFARQAIPMTWDFAEGNPFADSSGSLIRMAEAVTKAIEFVPATSPALVESADASNRPYAGAVISTDPPYYDNIGYSDLSDYFYVWQRRSLQRILPSVFGTLLVPKAEELVANPNRHGGKAGAKKFFEDGFRDVFRQARLAALPGFPITVYYAFKQSESGVDGQTSSGWETLLEGMVQSGWQITATWPMRSERAGRMISVGTNALASSIVLALRPRPDDAPSTDRRGFLAALRSELRGALETLQAGGIAPVDLPQAAIGPGMTVFSRYASVLEFDGKPMTVRSALARINEVLDEVLSEQEGDFDDTTRFCLTWFRQHGYGEGEFGAADSLARARNTAVGALEKDAVLRSARGRVQLFRPSDLSADYDVAGDDRVSTWEALHHLIRILETEDVAAAGRFLSSATGRADGAVQAANVTELAHLLFRICEENSWTKEAIAFNDLVTSWLDVLEASRSSAGSVQDTLSYEDD